MNCLKEYDSRFEDARKSVDNTKIEKLAFLLQKARDKRKQILIMGNGGSSTTASHFSLDLNKSTVKNLNAINEKRFKSMSLNDIAAITAYGNDISYDEVFSQQSINYLSKGGLEIVISASGNSPNILKAIKTAKDIGAYTFGLLGFDGGEAKNILDDYILVQTAKKEYRIVEDIHLQICHKVIECLEKRI
ncbi:SIS domain-containing protein [Candidatus Pacearchaeota archaeon]|nr:SIS domain-containing protein [Candidatus Pacearchaeota archaeon]MBI2057070.1 SIS domain-containing protein [Candidatus Pacearchaeota archaeon]